MKFRVTTLAFIFLVSSQIAIAQYETLKEELVNESNDSKVDDDVFKMVEQMPRFPGCEDIKGDHMAKKKCSDRKMLEFIYQNLKYPMEARKNDTEGQVVVQFVIEEDGYVGDMFLAVDIGDGCGEAVLDVIESMNFLKERWAPGRQRGKNVKVLYTLPVMFKLQGEKKKKKKWWKKN